jgi:redox-sensing transcriptional repressor
VEFGIISVPAVVAQHVFDKMVEAGIKGILNFAPCCLTSNDSGVFIQNVNLELELEQLVYFVKLGNKVPAFADPADGESICRIAV